MNSKFFITRFLPITFVAILVLAGLYGALKDDAPISTRAAVKSEFSLFWEDDFSGPQGVQPNSKYWNIETGGGGWGNDEKQVYTADSKNLRLDGNGRLIIEARAEANAITSARINSLGKMQATESLIEASIKMPAGKGLHPAFWLLGTSLPEYGYPEAGEIDIMELVNSGSIGHLGLHGPWIDPSKNSEPMWTHSIDIDPESDLSGEFHVYWVYRRPGVVTFGIDGDRVAQIKREDVSKKLRWVFDDPFFVVLNLAIGGQWPGEVQQDALPAKMEVDWLRVYG
ncbi:MAG: glycoside hydrolase family 16 protein [Mycobacteriaceae bacterium]